MTLELANIHSIDTITQLLKDLYVELGDENESVNFLSPEFIQHMLESKNTEVYLAYNHNRETVGLVSLTESQAFYAGGKYGVIDEMYIVPGFRSNNIGSQILSDIKHLAKQKGWKRLDVTAPTEDRWVRTIDFYKRNGFEFTGPKLKLRID